MDMDKIRYILICFLLLLSMSVICNDDTANIRTHRPKVGVVLSGGGAKGIAHVGALKYIEEKGIPIDYIAGTSMGSLVGGLYSVGYSTDSIEKIIKSMNWQSLVTDDIPRNYVIYNKRNNFGKYLITLYFDGKLKVDLPGGLVSGQNLQLFINKFFWNEFGHNDFSKFPIPFYCVGADIITGKPVILEKGDLHDALRASIAVPLVFSPMRIDTMLLVDGGVYNNFPVKEMKDRGVDIVIGVDVGFEPHTQEELKSLNNVSDQVFWISNVDNHEKEVRYCDILIKPQLGKYSLSSFTAVDTLVSLGREAAVKEDKSLDSLVAYFSKFDDSHYKLKIIPESNPLLLSNIKINGLEDASSERFFRDNFMLPVNYPVTADMVNDAILRERGTLNYKSVSYNIDSLNCMNIYVKKNNSRYNFQVGLNFDSYSYGKLVLNADINNGLSNLSQINIFADISRNPGIVINYYYAVNKKNRINRDLNKMSMVGATASLFFDNIYGWDEREKVAELRILTNQYKLFYQNYFQGDYKAEFGVSEEFVWNNIDMAKTKLYKFNESLVGCYFLFEKDSRNNAEYPTEGEYFCAFTDLQFHTDNTGYPFNINSYYEYLHIFSLGRNVFMSPEVCVGFNTSNETGLASSFYIGGATSCNAVKSFKLYGYDICEFINDDIIALYLRFRWHIVGNHHVLLNANIASLSDDFIKFNWDNIHGGIGVGYSFDSFIGPIEFILSQAFERGNPKIWINIGYHF